MNIYYIICGIIIAIGFLSFCFLALRARKKHKAIKHYESIRDKLTLREQEEVEAEIDYGGGFSLGRLIGGFVVILVGFSLLPEIGKVVGESCPPISQNVTSASAVLLCGGASGTMLGFVTLFFALGICMAAISMVVSGIRSVGLV